MSLRKQCLRIGFGLPVVAIGLLLWTDVFNFGELFLGRLKEGRRHVTARLAELGGAATAAPPTAPGTGPTPSPPTPVPEARAETEAPRAACRLAAAPKLEKRWGPLAREREGRPGGGRAGGGAAGLAGKRRRVGASIAVHPPKFYAASHFLEDWYFCPAAFEALHVVLVFTKEDDLQLFREAQACMSPEVPDGAWTGAVALTPTGGWLSGAGSTNQLIAAYKKWYGVAHMMDLGAEAPDYGMMLDAELVVHDFYAGGAAGRACSPGGAWSALFDRIRASDAGRTFPAARVSSTHTVYDFGAYKRSGRDYDRTLIKENLDFVMPKDCATPGCQEARRQEKECLYTWWTDLPWMNLTVAKRMLEAVAKKPAAHGFRNLSAGIRFPRFEIISYHQWCAMHEGFHFQDVTNLTGEAKWGSYLEDPMPGARINELQPMWISAEALLRSESGQIPAMSRDVPPLLIFHADHTGYRYYRRVDGQKSVWEGLVLDLMKLHGRRDFNKDSIKL